MKRIFPILAGIAALVATAVIGASTAIPASAAPPGAATNLSFGSQVCQSNGTVTGTLRWNPSGLGSQYADLALSSSFSNYSTGGPYAASANAVQFVQLKPGTTYYARIRTTAGGGTITSDTISITPSCAPSGGAAPAKPYNLRSQPLSNGDVRFTWTPGANDIWFCLDTATNLGALFGGYGSWSNHGTCWTTGNSLTISGLQCDTVYYWLLYTWNFNGNIKSDPAVVRTAPCPVSITAPTNLRTSLTSDGGVLFDWTPGQNNVWYCLDTAKNTSDLYGLKGTWENHGCGTTQSELVVYDLNCSEQYVWLIYAANASGWVKSSPATVQTQACKSEPRLEQAPIQDVDIVKTSSGAYRADIVAALPNGCHEPDSHRVQRNGNTIQITVWNSVVPGPCTLIYREYELSVNLGSDFVKGQTYEVLVNGERETFFVN